MITYPVVQHENMSCVPPDESVATPVPPPKKKMKPPEPPLIETEKLGGPMPYWYPKSKVGGTCPPQSP